MRICRMFRYARTSSISWPTVETDSRIFGSALRRYWIRWPVIAFACARIDLGERLDARERVVEEVRLDLRLQRRELGLGHLLAHAVVLGLAASSVPPRACEARERSMKNFETMVR